MTPDFSLRRTARGAVAARCSCWVRDGLGIVGEYEAQDACDGTRVLDDACRALAKAGCQRVVGPMDGTTWASYRFVTEGNGEPPFFLEPDHPDDWPRHWTEAGFSPCETYTSALNDDLSIEDPLTGASLTQLSAEGVSIRTFRAESADRELHRIFDLSAIAFRDNPFYAPVSRQDFCGRMRALLPFVRPELVLLAESRGDLVAFMFALPDVLQAKRGAAPDTVILKTLAVHPALRGRRLGSVLMDLVQRRARAIGFRRAIHALMHDANASRRISGRYARVFRRYALFSRTCV